jgi:hypothetical protein
MVFGTLEAKLARPNCSEILQYGHEPCSLRTIRMENLASRQICSRLMRYSSPLMEFFSNLICRWTLEMGK